MRLTNPIPDGAKVKNWQGGKFKPILHLEQYGHNYVSDSHVFFMYKFLSTQYNFDAGYLL